MDINTGTIIRLRDALIEGGQLPKATARQRPGEENATHNDAALARFYPFAEAMYLTMMIDNHADDCEVAAIRGAMRILTNCSLEDRVLEEIFRRCRERVSDYGVEACLQGIGATLAADSLDRETAFSLAAAVALADGNVESEETELIESLSEWFGVSRKRADALLNVP
jgi:tellurite resistance protein